VAMSSSHRVSRRRLLIATVVLACVAGPVSTAAAFGRSAERTVLAPVSGPSSSGHDADFVKRPRPNKFGPVEIEWSERQERYTTSLFVVVHTPNGKTHRQGIYSYEQSGHSIVMDDIVFPILYKACKQAAKIGLCTPS
jgi:hypothetical protein